MTRGPDILLVTGDASLWSMVGGCQAKGKVGKCGGNFTDSKVFFSPFLSLFFFLIFLLQSLFHTLSCLLCLSRSLDENSTNQLRINRDSDNTTTNSPFTATGAARGPTQHCCTSAHQHGRNHYACILIFLLRSDIIHIHLLILALVSMSLEYVQLQHVVK